MSHSPSEWELAELIDYARSAECQAAIRVAGIVQYVPARPMKNIDSLRERARLAWAVFKGEADALYWPGQPTPKRMR